MIIIYIHYYITDDMVPVWGETKSIWQFFRTIRGEKTEKNDECVQIYARIPAQKLLAHIESLS